LDENGDWLDTKIHCGLYFSELVPTPTTQAESSYLYFAALPLGEGLSAKIEDFMELV
jgi:hypothetical protein